MTGEASVTVQGTEELRRNFAELKASAQPNVIRAALRGATRPVINGARQRVPVRTGLGRRSIQAAVDRDRQNKHSFVASIGFAKKAFYLAFVELGTARLAARPFLRPAFNAAHKEMLQAFFDTMGKRIAKIKAKQSGGT